MDKQTDTQIDGLYWQEQIDAGQTYIQTDRQTDTQIDRCSLQTVLTDRRTDSPIRLQIDMQSKTKTE